MWIFNSNNFIMPHQFVQNKFVQEFVVISLLICAWDECFLVIFLIFQFAFWFPVAVNHGTQGKTRDCILWINGDIVHLATGGIWVHCSLILYLLIHFFFSIQFYVDYLGCVLKTSQWCSRACAASENCSAWKYIHLKSTYAVSDYSRKWGRWFWMLPEVAKIL